MAELRLLHCLPTHLSFREIAEQLFVSTNTVKTQARSIYRKLGVSSRAEAVATAGAAGLIETGERLASVSSTVKAQDRVGLRGKPSAGGDGASLLRTSAP